MTVHTHVCDIPFLTSSAMHSYIVRNNLHVGLPNRTQFIDAMSNIIALHTSEHTPEVGKTRVEIEFDTFSEASHFQRGFSGFQNLKGLSRIALCGSLVSLDFYNSKPQSWYADVPDVDTPDVVEKSEVESLREEIQQLKEIVQELTKQVKCLNKTLQMDSVDI